MQSSRTCPSAPVSNVSNPTRDRHRPRPPRSPVRFFVCFVLATTGARVRRPRLPRSSIQISPIFLFARDRGRLAPFVIVPDTSLPNTPPPPPPSDPLRVNVSMRARASTRFVAVSSSASCRRSPTRVRAADFPSDDRMYARTRSHLASREAVWSPRFLRLVAPVACRTKRERRRETVRRKCCVFSHSTLRTANVFLQSRRGQPTFKMFILFFSFSPSSYMGICLFLIRSNNLLKFRTARTA